MPPNQTTPNQPAQPPANPSYVPPQATGNPFASQRPTYNANSQAQAPAQQQTSLPPQPPAKKGMAGTEPGRKINPNSTQNNLQFAEIRDGIMIMNDGSFRAVVMAKSINFDLMSQAEQDGVEFSYQGFLNSLYFDTQILIQSRKIDMGPYLDKLEQIRSQQDNMLLGMLMADYLDFIEDLVSGTNIMDKKFYIIVQYSKEVDSKQAAKAGGKKVGGIFAGNNTGKVKVNQADLEAAKTELKNRVQLVVNGLINMGIQSVPLNTKELIELMYNSYNPDLAAREPLGNNTDFNSPIVTKGDGHAPKPNLQGAI